LAGDYDMPNPIRTLDRYVTGEFLRYWLAALMSFVTIFVVVNLFEKISKFLEYDVATFIILKYYLFMIPYIIKWMNPIAVLLGVLFALGALSRNSEIVAMTASGVSLRRIVIPIVIAGFMVSVGIFFFGETVVPYANEKKNEIEMEHIERRPVMSTLRRINVVYRGKEDHFYYIKVFDGVRMNMRDVRVMERDEKGNLVKLIVAREAEWRNERWRFENGTVRIFNRDGSISMETFEKKYFDLPEKPENFLSEQKEPEAMEFLELAAFVDDLKSSGVDASAEEVELYLKLSVPLANLVVIFIGAPLALTSHRQGMAFGFGLAVILGFGLWGALAVGRALGQNGTLPPALAAFLPDITFFGLGLVFLFRARS
jgi:lipopolysaccharide export system permease protein